MSRLTRFVFARPAMYVNVWLALLFLCSAFSTRAAGKSLESILAAPQAMCAVVQDAAGNVVNSFCPSEAGSGQQCVSSHTQCMVSSYDSHYHSDTGQVPWYQVALDWAAANVQNPQVTFDPGVIWIDSNSKLPAAWPFGDGVGMQVSSGIRLRGASDQTHRTVIQASSDTNISAMILVAHDRWSNASVSDVQVQDFDLIGTDAAVALSGADCPSDALTMTSILTYPNPPSPIPAHLSTRVGYGLVVGESNAGELPVSVSRMKVSHVGAGIAYGWNTSVQPESAACNPQTCLHLSFEQTAQCSSGPDNYSMTLRLPSDTSAHPYCVHAQRSPGCQQNFCPVMPHEFRGNASAMSQVYNNQICDAGVGINYVGGNARIFHNSVLRSLAASDIGFGLSVDGHTPYSSATQWYENYVYGYNTGFLTDGSQYVFIPDAEFFKVTGLNRSDFPDYQSVLNIQQIIFDRASQYYAQADPFRGFIDHVAIRDNHFYGSSSVSAISLYRVNWAWVGFNEINNTSSLGQSGVLLDNTINSWIYGNLIKNSRYGIRQVGTPGVQSYWGSCYNGIGIYYNGDEGTFVPYPNTYQGVGIPEYQEPGSCNPGYRPN